MHANWRLNQTGNGKHARTHRRPNGRMHTLTINDGIAMPIIPETSTDGRSKSVLSKIATKTWRSVDTRGSQAIAAASKARTSTIFAKQSKQKAYLQIV